MRFGSIAGYVKSLHRPENELILLHVPEMHDGDKNSKYISDIKFLSLFVSVAHWHSAR